MKVNYIADDGTVFDTKEACDKYERESKNLHPFKMIEIFDKNTLSVVAKPVAFINGIDSFCKYIEYLCSPEIGLKEIISVQGNLYDEAELNNHWVTYVCSVSEYNYNFKIVSIDKLLESYNQTIEAIQKSIEQLTNLISK